MIGLGMANGIGERFLNHPEADGLEFSRKIPKLGFDDHLAGQVGEPGLLIDIPAQGRY